MIEETSFLSNRIANLIRENTIDYAEYLSQEEGAIRFGDNPAKYEARFYSFPTCEPGESDGDDNNLDGTVCDHDDSHAFNEGFFDTGADNDFGNDDESSSAIGSHTQNKLFLISSDGETKYVLSRRDNGIDDDSDGTIDEDGIAARSGDDGGENLGPRASEVRYYRWGFGRAV